MNAATAASTTPIADQQEATPLEDVREGRIEDDGERQNGTEGLERRVAGRPEKGEHLARREDRDERDRDRDGEAADRDDDQEKRDEDDGGRRALAHPAYRPKRRWRRANSSSAWSNASGPKSGHSASQK